MHSVVRYDSIVLSAGSSTTLSSVSGAGFSITVVSRTSRTAVPDVLVPVTGTHEFVLTKSRGRLPPAVVDTGTNRLRGALFRRLVGLCPSGSRLLGIRCEVGGVLVGFPGERFCGGKLGDSTDIGRVGVSSLLNSGGRRRTLLFVGASGTRGGGRRRLGSSGSVVGRLRSGVTIDVTGGCLSTKIGISSVKVVDPCTSRMGMVRSRAPIRMGAISKFRKERGRVVVVSAIEDGSSKGVKFLGSLEELGITVAETGEGLVVIKGGRALGGDPACTELVRFIRGRGSLVSFWRSFLGCGCCWGCGCRVGGSCCCGCGNSWV